ncbi:methenyltetrahydromethanopterin cyclohydrolase [Natronobacterium gregoryi]|uniref:Methenyltetrahydromethanopterin cyclohydrolase n=2 Tax=Natronobacterium gregoryi TaxID=44930 RepID=L0ALR1_NATGS|nr:methenyltetrahydromethanopterin cyclohydrolase [Natronobacterium gregoryi]AFZ73995.1 methenyltetrahydromethanopterin cyclohydrolase [Natronobacterium gregoryi SP2]ELY68809.1 N(5),N(10)-methenyltetrahydromethanopterin cyclohydrolase [Natronobacterium gregoryi SP2]PLK18240.1 methenyltetrahydromethanopterin cyclohydrolase [Natronobacterium gregoryi SP2]SFJ73242.1 methenyltetrahydromethanopterin cyclohydrolase [Natronobacterium gregoryi]
MESLNRMAIELVDEALDYAEELNVGGYDLENEATVLDFGIEFDGGVEAGLLLTEIQTAGMATPSHELGSVGDAPVPYVELTTDQPALSLLCSQKAGWELATEDFEGLGSGPARALVAEEDEFRRIGYTDAFDLTALAVETDELPPESAAEQVAELAEVETSSVFLLAYPTASIAGSITNAARAAELATFRLTELGYGPLDIVSATGRAPVAPVADDERTAIARTNDAIAYGGTAHLTVREDDDVFDSIPSTAAEDHGRPFEAVFDDLEWEFEEVPADLFAPAKVTVDVIGGPTYVHGETDEDVLLESFDL